MLTFAMRCNLGVTLTELTKPKNVTVPVREVLLDETLPDPGNFNKTFASGLYLLACASTVIHIQSQTGDNKSASLINYCLFL